MSRWLGTVRAALLAPANVLGLASAGGASLVTGQATPALVALAVEAFYLLLVAEAGRQPGARKAFRRSGTARRRSPGPAL